MAYPKDRFDELPEDLKRVGAHRGPRRRGGGWIGFAWAALATLLLIVGGIFVLKVVVGLNIDIPFISTASSPAPLESPQPTAAPTADPVLDPTTIDPARAIKTSIYNGTTTAELQNTVGDALAAAGWVIDTRARASTSDVGKTTVYYSDPLNEDVARGLVVALGIGEIRLVPADTFPGNPITIVIGLDYPGATPGG
ncbi:MAG: LytR C-terminal domain-containing protein [Salinibacterium sp.]|nr:LytR C-terminal domain-containing protein [Salinibacterium sp.]